ncbi:protein translocase subunit SecF [Thiospirillum jenense]|uniref:Protein-export membrane protein SecF n=1 Tax=Thiospirillum jenense TaxID=1653858 RepID=A0A839HCK9_9GAMM|nr:protein translocase subunit SecF [Thiospirillum jenense]MBB1125880.1 protein translocase subunit SecF [Thiospirillum jenense]
MAHLRIIKNLNIDFMGKRFVAMTVSAVTLFVCLLSFVIQGLNFGLDFTGGTVVEVGYAKPTELDTVTRALNDNGFNHAMVQYFGSRQDVLIRLPPPAENDNDAEENKQPETQAMLSNRLFQVLSKAADGQLELRRVEFVGPQVGAELREQGGLAVLFALIGILIYVALRFEWRFAVGAVAAIVHDVIFTVGMFSLFYIPFDLNVLAAVLALSGYSLNDTIVIFDRVRENFRKQRKGTVIELINRAINETLSRTFITAGATLLVLLAPFFFGGEALYGFSLVLIIGIFVGTYSTIYVATAIVVWLGTTRADLIPPVTKEGQLVDDRP